MSDVDIAVAGETPDQSPVRRGAANKSPLRLIRLAVEKPTAAVDFLRARSEGVMDLIAHFWERLAQTPPLARADLHLVAAVADNGDVIGKEYISTLNYEQLLGAMLYVPKAHRADVLALDSITSSAFAAYISHQGPRAVRETVPPARVEMGELLPAESATAKLSESSITEKPQSQIEADTTPAAGDKLASAASFRLTDLSGTAKGGVTTVEVPAEISGPTRAVAWANSSNAKVPIDFLTGHADGIRWMTPPLLAAVNRKTPAREMVNVVMQLPAEAVCQSDAAVRTARGADLPALNRWRRQYKEERGILFDADMGALVDTGRVFVYEHNTQAVAVAKFDLELPGVVEIGGVYTFPEFRTRGFGTRIVADLAARIRQMGKIPTLQVDEENIHALSIYQAMGWQPRGKLARVWLTG